MGLTDEGGMAGSKEGGSGLPRQLRFDCRLREMVHYRDLPRGNNLRRSFVIINICAWSDGALGWTC